MLLEINGKASTRVRRLMKEQSIGEKLAGALESGHQLYKRPRVTKGGKVNQHVVALRCLYIINEAQ